MALRQLARVAATALLLAGFGCGGDESGTGGSGSASSDAATTGASTSTGTGGGSSSSGSCQESWECTPWETSGGNDATRVCTDKNACGTTNGKPVETATLPALDMNFYKCNVEPILDHKCSQLGCHGTETGRPLRIYARGRLRLPGAQLADQGYCQGQQSASDICNGSVTCGCKVAHTDEEWQKNYDSARSFALDANGQPIAAGQEDTSELIAQPVVGGKAHAGIHLFKTGDSDHQTISQWLSGQTLASCDPGFN